MISCGKERAACRNIMIKNGVEIDGSASAVSYTHLTLPTILLV